jgi:hypothetical protein
VVQYDQQQTPVCIRRRTPHKRIRKRENHKQHQCKPKSEEQEVPQSVVPR